VPASSSQHSGVLNPGRLSLIQLIWQGNKIILLLAERRSIADTLPRKIYDKEYARPEPQAKAMQ